MTVTEVFSQFLAALTKAVVNNIGPHPALRLQLEAFFTAKYT